MDNKEITAAVKTTLASVKRNFKQKIDFVVNLKEIDLKKTDEQIEFFLTLPHAKGKAVDICALVGPELLEEAKKHCKTAILADDFDKYQKDKKLCKKLAEDHDLFIAQVNVMPKVAAAFGRVLGPRGKMPNPKAGCVVPPKGDMAALTKQLQRQVKVSAKTSLVYQTIVGSEDMKVEDIAENVATLYTQLIHHLPKEHNNIRSIFVKATMGQPVEIKSR